ncbi:outer membrane lipoprotein-sorting protein [Croceifilum oryzae]|uniref:Outer membrane lipoprotein-sorting protein n=1 Tax=Croceifilum oryzae TaxID=1553429 RepID=A0AAJ1TM49_9BACL|nr:outer membrane lipoprotein carrier protein LolA [Croceifilum oryzae]MDQ0418431.1 outer membrane lipoprotein-sorting protein [Croceifilum oryzae]
MRQKSWFLAFALILSLFLSACEKSSEDVVSDLRKQPEKIDSYTGHGKLTLQSGKKNQEVDVEVWYKSPNLYRVQLKNETSDVTQVLLKNEKGVYVLTPHLKKSYRFQSDWPATSGQIYLYQTILSSIVEDSSRKVETGEKGYQFEVSTTKYMNKTWVKQKIWLTSDYKPEKVEVYDEKDQSVVKMVFDRFEYGTKFDKDVFDSERNLTQAPVPSKETLGRMHSELSTITPGVIPQGTTLADEQTIQGANGSIVVQRFQGAKPFTISQRKAMPDQLEKASYGKPVQVQSSLGMLLEFSTQKSLTWVDSERQVEYEMVSSMDTSEMIEIATSLTNQSQK